MFNYVLVVSIILLNKNNFLIIKNPYFSDFIAKVKIKGNGIHNILCPEILHIDNQAYPNDVFIKKENETINVTEKNYFINSEEAETFVIMKWYNYPSSTRSMFENCTNIKEIDLTEFNLTPIINAENMFFNCKSLTSIKFGNFDTPFLNSTYKMFYHCSSLISIDLSEFNTSNVVNMGLMFYECSALESMLISNFNKAKVKNFNQTFIVNH